MKPNEIKYGCTSQTAKGTDAPRALLAQKTHARCSHCDVQTFRIHCLWSNAISVYQMDRCQKQAKHDTHQFVAHGMSSTEYPERVFELGALGVEEGQVVPHHTGTELRVFATCGASEVRARWAQHVSKSSSGPSRMVQATVAAAVPPVDTQIGMMCCPICCQMKREWRIVECVAKSVHDAMLAAEYPPRLFPPIDILA